MKFKNLLIALSMCSTPLCYGQTSFYNQQENFLNANSVWVFGDSAGIDFNGGYPQAIKTKKSDILQSSSGSYEEGGASVADPLTGQLRFYCDLTIAESAVPYLYIRNRNGDVMPNGSFTVFGSNNTNQGVCVVPFIGNPDKYYLFSLIGPTGGSNYFIQPTLGNVPLFYSVIDMSLDNSLGDVVMNQRNIPLLPPINGVRQTPAEAMIAIPGNNCDVWLMVHEQFEPVFKAFHITSEGVDTTPVVSQTNPLLDLQNGTTYDGFCMGGMAVSPDRQRIAITTGNNASGRHGDSSKMGVLLFKFNPTTGTVSDPIMVKRGKEGYSVAFSPDNSKLYMFGPIGTMATHLYQYDISTYDSTLIANSEEMIATLNPPRENYPATAVNLRLYRDTIYVNAKTITFEDTYIGTINQPNLSGSACDFQPQAIPLVAGTSTSLGLPNEVVYPMQDTTYTLTDTLICTTLTDGITLSPTITTDSDTYTWSDGTTDSAITISDSGTYWVGYYDGCNYQIDTFVVRGYDLDPIINVDGFSLGTTRPYASYQWLFNGDPITGATSRTYTVTENGDYTVVVTDENGCTDTSDIYNVNNVSIEDAESLAGTVIVYPNPTEDLIYIQAPIPIDLTLSNIEGRLIQRISNAKNLSLKDLASGIYFLRVTDTNGQLIKMEKVVKQSNQ